MVTDSLAMRSHSHEIVTAADIAPYMEVTTTSCYTLTGVILLWHWVGSRGLTTLQESYSKVAVNTTKLFKCYDYKQHSRS